jgi:hypothetical protein
LAERQKAPNNGRANRPGRRSNHGGADKQALERDPGLAKRLKAVRKALGYLEGNPRHPALNTQKFSSIRAPSGEEVFEAYAENKTPSAYRLPEILALRPRQKRHNDRRHRPPSLTFTRPMVHPGNSLSARGWQGLGAAKHNLYKILAIKFTHLLTGDLKHFGPHLNRPEASAGIVIQAVSDVLAASPCPSE